VNQERIELYVTGQLGQAEAEAFEDYCVANPEFARLVEHEQRLRAGIAQVATGSTAEFIAPANRRPWRLATAAAVLIAVMGGVYVWNRIPGAYAPPVLAAVVHDGRYAGETLRLARVRGSETIPVLERGLVRVEIVGLFDPASDYSLTLDRRIGADEVEIVSTLNGLHPASATSLEVSIDGVQLQPGAYSLRLSKQGSAEDVLEFGFARR
jgi:hypothetical protein